MEIFQFWKNDTYLAMKIRGKFYKMKTLKVGDKEVEQISYESFSDAKGDKKRLIEFIDFWLRWVSKYLDYVLETPDEYKKRRGLKWNQ